MKRSIVLAMLEHLAESGKLMIDAFFPKYYPGTGPVRELFGLDTYYRSMQAAKNSLSSTLSRLKKQGLVSRVGSKKQAQWIITRNGKNYLLKKKSEGAISASLPPVDGILHLVTFDVPERERGKRLWLRQRLLECEYKTLHKSVFIGKRPLPEEFMREIDFFRLNKYIHILSVGKEGTLGDEE